MAGRTRYTADELERAIRLKARDLTWAEVGYEMGRAGTALSVAVSAYRRGLWAPAKQTAAKAALNAEIERLVLEEGVTSLHSISRRVGIGVPTVSLRLGRLGLDHEMRLALAGAARTNGSYDARRPTP